jgi:hypothetical protein
MRARILVITAAVAAAVIVLPSSASAATTCSFAGGVVDIDVTNGTFQVVVDRNGSTIEINDPFVTGAVTCAGGAPTVTTTDTIVFDESATTGQGTSLAIDLSSGPFEPGVTNETGSSDEIEFTANTDSDGTDRIFVTGGAANDNLRMGSLGGANQGVNLNGAEADGLDVDITGSGLEGAGASGAGGNDTITADGSGGAGLGFTGPLGFDVSFEGLGDDDTITTGSGANNRADGNEGNDTLTGGLNGDALNPGTGNDTVDGAGGTDDLVSYLNHNQGVTVDLRITAPQNTIGAGTDTISNVEGAIGGNQSDTLTGTESAAVGDRLIGGQLGNDTGDDVLIGKAGPDLLRGAPGNDTLIGGAGDDTLDGSPGTDTASYAQDSTGGITFSLSQAQTGVAQNTGGAGSDTLFDHNSLFGPTDGQHEVENITGSEFPDDLTGNDGANRIVGGAGQDAISLLGGVDTFDAYDGVQDEVNCGDAADSGTADEQGVDSLSNCETPDFAPSISIAGGPADGATVTDPTPTYSLTADEPASFQVRVDSGGFGACPADCELPSLADGTHTIVFRAVDADEAGNVGLNPITRTITVDTTAPPPPEDAGNGSGEPSQDAPKDQRAPETTVKRPKVNGDDVTLRFVSDEPASSFLCGLDGKKLRPCASPKRYRNLDDGTHKVLVAAVDAAGNRDASPAKRKFEIG